MQNLDDQPNLFIFQEADGPNDVGLQPHDCSVYVDMINI